ncbi:hypothetical protein OC835_004711 [Tilletia horrida]|nr:hypothetical protein OC835_004711 [Tilletia horrida]
MHFSTSFFLLLLGASLASILPAQGVPAPSSSSSLSGKAANAADAAAVPRAQQDASTAVESTALDRTSTSASASVRVQVGPIHHGQATWYTQDGLEAACGGWYSDEAFVVALPFWRQENCFRKVKIEAHGVTRYAVAVDSCPTCAHFQLDMSPGLFKQFENMDVGMFPITWQFVS